MDNPAATAVVDTHTASQRSGFRRTSWHGYLIILGAMSLFSWYIILTKLWDQRKLKQSARAVESSSGQRLP